MSKAIISTEVQAAPVAPATPAVQTRPGVVVITEPTNTAFAVAAHFIRIGYIVSPDIAPEVFPAIGQSTITLVLGSPDAHAVAVAASATAHAIALQRVAFDREVAEAARQMVEAAAREKKQAALEEAVAEQTKALRKLKDQLAAA